MKIIRALALGAISLSFAVSVQAGGDIAAGKAKSQTCWGCHGIDGNSMTPLYPKLAGLGEEYIVGQLKDFKSGARKSPIMAPFVAGLSEKDMRNIAAYFDSQPPKSGVAAADKETLVLGEKLYRGGNAKTGVSACMSCHGPSGHGIPPHYPLVGGQHAAYTEKQLQEFKAGVRTNDYQQIMSTIAARMSDAEIKAVSQYMAGLRQAEAGK